MRWLFWKALFGLLAFDIGGLDRNFARLHNTVNRWPTAKRPVIPGMVDRICEAVDHACIWYPRSTLCLKRSVVTTCLLRSSGVPAQLVVGAQHLPFKAHAWVELADRPIHERTDVRSAYVICERC
jgi:Transglutaminase-like superfamily